MNPALSVVFFTTLAGAGQGLLLALVAAEWSARHGWIAMPLAPGFAAAGALLAAALACAGLVASFFHLGHPERAWRAAMFNDCILCWHRPPLLQRGGSAKRRLVRLTEIKRDRLRKTFFFDARRQRMPA